jgi:AraC family transcriptional regulator
MPASPATLPHRPDTEAAHQAAVEKVILHMKANLDAWDTDLSLAALAREGRYSQPHLIEVFEEVTGTTPHHFLASLRIQKAKELLIQTTRTVTDIALEVGYQSFPTFSRTFKDYVGLPPAEFRKLPPTISASELFDLVRTFVASQKPPSDGEQRIEGIIQAPPCGSGVIFVGTFNRGVPQGVPFSGTVMLKAGTFSLKRPGTRSFHLLAALVEIPQANGGVCPHQFQPLLVTNHHVLGRSGCAHLRLRPLCHTDPPLVMSLSEVLR